MAIIVGEKSGGGGDEKIKIKSKSIKRKGERGEIL